MADTNRNSHEIQSAGVWRTIIMAAILFLPAGCGKSEQSQARPPDVEVVRVEQKDVPIWKDWIGTLDGLVNAQIKPQVTGYLLRQTYKDGSLVKKDQLLFEIDPRTFQAAVDQAKGQLASAEGQLAQAQANQIKAQNDVNRYTPLAKEQAIPQQDLDNAIQANKAAIAQVAAAKAQVEAAKAQVASAQLNLGFTKVRLTHRRDCRNCPGADRRPRDPKYSSYDRFDGRSHQNLLPRKRAGIPGLR